VAERYADGLVGVQEYKAAMRAVSTMTRRETEAGGGFPDGPLLFGQKLLDFLRLKHLPGWEGLQPRVEGFSFVSDEQKRNREAQRSRGIGVITEEQALEFQNINDAFSKAHTNFLRCIFGNPFRPVSLNPSWVTPTVTNLAEAAYQHRDLPSGELNTARLAILADALEEAGCDNQEILGHLRSPGPHFLGCHVLDLLLGKE
jgi:hypothetical protein